MTVTVTVLLNSRHYTLVTNVLAASTVTFKDGVTGYKSCYLQLCSLWPFLSRPNGTFGVQYISNSSAWSCLFPQGQGHIQRAISPVMTFPSIIKRGWVIWFPWTVKLLHIIKIHFRDSLWWLFTNRSSQRENLVKVFYCKLKDLQLLFRSFFTYVMKMDFQFWWP